MLPEQLKNFREMVTLKDGTYVLLRPMVSEDESRLMDFYSAVSDEDLRLFRHRVKERALIREWSEHLDYGRVLPLLALVKDRVVGNISLHFCEGPKRHTAEIRLFLAKDYRRRGLGTKILRTLIDLARKQGLGVLMVEIVADDANAIKAFEGLGFKPQATLQDGFMFPDGEAHDLVLLTMPLQGKIDEF
jgi:RimJ/RimL family protein N-acetyltransferase